MSQSRPATATAAPLTSPFQRLAALLAGLAPGREPVVDMSLGEPHHPQPPFLKEALEAALAQFGRYPPIRGTAELRAAIGGWIARRYPATRDLIDVERQVLPLCGSREGLFLATFPALARKRVVDRPAVLVPNPFYPAYAAAAGRIPLDAVALPATRASGFLPDLDAIPRRDLERAVAFYLASPSNPQGAVASAQYLARAIALARAHDFMLFADECYSEIYTREAPTGALEVAAAQDGGFANVVAFQSLSKRSNLPGLRSGFCAGDAAFIDAFATFRNVAAPQMPLPVQHVSAVCWSEESHVEASRALYRAKFAAAERILAGRFGYATPAGGFFLWLDVSAQGGGERVTKTLWQRCGVRVVPGAYLARPSGEGVDPGADYVRVALVDDLATTEEGLRRIVAALG